MTLSLLCETESYYLGENFRFFYHSELYKLMSEGVSDMHCRSDQYLVEELEEEIQMFLNKTL